MKFRFSFVMVILLLSCSMGVLAQVKPLPNFKPSEEQMAKRFVKAQSNDALARKLVYKTVIMPRWTSANGFWYRNNLVDSTTEYIYVEPANNVKRPAFDHAKVAAALKAAGASTVDAKRLAVRDLYFYPGGDKMAISLVRSRTDRDSAFYEVNLSNFTATKLTKMPDDPYNISARQVGRGGGGGGFSRFRRDGRSPDGKWTVSVKNNNVYIQPQGGEAIAYTTDGTADLPYDENNTTWSPDSRYLVTYKVKRVIDKPVYHILTSLEGTRGVLKSQPYKQPGDSFTCYTMAIVNREDKSVKKVNTEIIDFMGAPQPRWFNDENGKFLFERADRGHQRFRIVEVTAATGDTRNIVDEQTKTFIYEQKIVTNYNPATGEILWISEKDGWRHIYLVDGKKGVIKNAVTKGEWVVRAIDSIDYAKREVWFQASGMNASTGEDPYNIHYYRIGFDGNNLVSLTPAPGNHRLTVSPDKQYFVDVYSTPEVPPVSIVGKTSDGKKVMDLEKADVSKFLAAGFRLPEVFHAKGRDGVTDIWGIIYRPADFDPTKRYPIIENIYAGPQDSFVPKVFGVANDMQGHADLGFIVVQIDGMGTFNRSKAFHDVCWKNLGDAGFPDRILWMKALAKKYPQADTTRVGIYGTSAGGQNSLGGMLFHPEWYKAAVSSCGCHDNRVDKQWWNEQWMGYPIGKHYDEQSNITNAYKLQGKLLLIVGEADTNVPPESTYRVCDALIKAKKQYDFLAIPGANHTNGGPYGNVKRRDFFVKNLLGVDPPNRNADVVSGE